MLSMMVMSFLSRDIDSCSLPFVMKSLPRPGIMLYNVHMYRRVIVYNVHIQVGSTDSGPEDSLTPDSTHATAIWQQMHIHLQIQQYGNTMYSKEKKSAYHNLTEWSHFHDVLELFIHVSQCELT